MKRTPDPFLVEKFLRAADLHAATTDDDDDDPADGYNPGPEIAVTWNDTTLTIQRTHLHDDTARYYWRIMQDGMLEPVADGDIVTPATTSTVAAARRLAWYLYAGNVARIIEDDHAYTVRTDNGADHLPEYRDDIQMIYLEGLA